MANTGANLKDKLKSPSGTILFIALALSLVALSLGADMWLHLVSSKLLLPWLACFTGVVVLGEIGIPILQQLKTGQVIREDGPQDHLKKAGTPTMGGIFVVPIGIVVALIWSGFNAEVLAACLLTLSFAAIGWFDDWQILFYKSNKGISPLKKLALQGSAAIAFCGWLALTRSDVSLLHFPFQLELPLGLLFWPLALFVIIGGNNATNLTDGLDGLAAGTGAIALMGLAILIGYEHNELVTFCACMSGSYTGFLWHNRNPAKVFMGNTGSLALGGALAATALLGNMLWGLLVVGAIFVWECISVIAQVAYFKATKNSSGVGQRLFKMAPYHHHLELMGWTETQVVGVFYLVGIALVLGAIVLKLA